MAAALSSGIAAGCGSAVGSLAPGALGVSARDAFIEARTTAHGWRTDSRLRWVEGQGINANGMALRDAGAWFFHFTSPGTQGELLVRITATETASEERPFSSPPGLVIGDNAVGGSWVDSRVAVQAAAAAGGEIGGDLRLLLVPSRPAQWHVRSGDTTWYVHAETGEVLR